jgi:S-adenosylmethionine synthetase
MFEKVNPSHPDKVADRIAGAIVDAAYSLADSPKIAIEVLIGHGVCHIISESSVNIPSVIVEEIVTRITGDINMKVDYVSVPQDVHLAKNQENAMRCGDNGIFKGMPVTSEQRELSDIARSIYAAYPTDGKYVKNGDRLIICQSNANREDLLSIYQSAEVNPLGDWTGGTDVDTGATNRKLGSDMADSVTGGGLHGKDLSKADVSVNIYAWIEAQRTGRPVVLCCAIGDDTIDGKPYQEVVNVARDYIKSVGGFEKFAEWGLV